MSSSEAVEQTTTPPVVEENNNNDRKEQEETTEQQQQETSAAAAEPQQEQKEVEEEKKEEEPAPPQQEQEKQNQQPEESSSPAAVPEVSPTKKEEDTADANQQQQEQQNDTTTTSALVATNNKSEDNSASRSLSRQQQQQQRDAEFVARDDFIFGHKQIARHHKQQQQASDRTNKAAKSSLRSIDEIATKSRNYNQVHTMIESLNREEEQLFVEIPAKIGNIRIKKNNNNSTSTNGIATMPPRNNDNNTGSSSGNNGNSPYKMETSPAPQKKKIMSAADAGVQKQTPLPLRNNLPPSEVVSPSRFRDIPEPSENKKELVREKKEKELEKVLVKPGQKCPPRQNVFVYEQKPVKKVEKDFIPSCESKRPAHWPEPEKATRRASEGGMKYSYVTPSRKDRSSSTVVDEEYAEEEEVEVQE